MKTDHIITERVAKALKGHLEYFVSCETEPFFECCESPIEVMLGSAISIVWKTSLSFLGPLYLLRHIPDEEHWREAEANFLIPQYEVPNLRRLDFLLYVKSGKREIRIAIECDGHAFHERTKEQAAKDRSVDRQLQAAGYHVMRFTGSEIYNNLARVASELAKFAQDKILQAGSSE